MHSLSILVFIALWSFHPLLYSLQPKPKKRRFWLCDPPRESRTSRAPTNRSILYEILAMTEARTSAQQAASDVVQNRIQPFYASIGLPTKSMNTMKAAAKALYDQHRRLITLKVREKRPKDFDERCNTFAGNLDKVFNVAPAGSS